MGHIQPKTPITTDNTTEQGLITKKMIPKRAKSYDMRFNFLKCREAQKQFNFIWRWGKDSNGKYNKADYHRKLHPVKHYIAQISEHVIDMPVQSQ